MPTHLDPELRDRAGQLLTDYQARLDTIRADTALTDEGKRPQLASAWLNTYWQIENIHRLIEAETNTRRDRLEKALVQPERPGILSSSAADRVAFDASYRDALARANQADTTGGDQALTDLLHEARLVGDTLQERAVVATAYRLQRIPTLNAYIELEPTIGPDLEELFELKHGAAAMRAQMDMHMHFPLPLQPPELSQPPEPVVGPDSIAERYGVTRPANAAA